MTKLIAIHKIRHNFEGAMEFTGKFDSRGEPIVRSVTKVICSGEVFEVPQHVAGEEARLLEMGAARPATVYEIELADQASSDG